MSDLRVKTGHLTKSSGTPSHLTYDCGFTETNNCPGSCNIATDCPSTLTIVCGVMTGNWANFSGNTYVLPQVGGLGWFLNPPGMTACGVASYNIQLAAGTCNTLFTINLCDGGSGNKSFTKSGSQQCCPYKGAYTAANGWTIEVL